MFDSVDTKSDLAWLIDVSGCQYHTALREDGRKIEWVVYGRENATRTAVFHHGSPFSACSLALPRLIERIPEDMRIIAVTRPGFGNTEPHKSISFNTVMSDIEAVLEHHDVVADASMGFSLGSIFAVEFAKRHDVPLLLVSGVSPVYDDVLLEGMAEMQAGIFRSVRSGEVTLAQKWPGEIIHQITEGAVDVDKERAFSDTEIMNLLAHDAHHAAKGTGGFANDLDLWISLSNAYEHLKKVVAIIHGKYDNAAPIAMGRANLAGLFGTHGRFSEMHAGHYLLYYRWTDVLNTLNRMMK